MSCKIMASAKFECLSINYDVLLHYYNDVAPRWTVDLFIMTTSLCGDFNSHDHDLE